MIFSPIAGTIAAVLALAIATGAIVAAALYRLELRVARRDLTKAAAQIAERDERIELLQFDRDDILTRLTQIRTAMTHQRANSYRLLGIISQLRAEAGPDAPDVTNLGDELERMIREGGEQRG